MVSVQGPLLQSTFGFSNGDNTYTKPVYGITIKYGDSCNDKPAQCLLSYIEEVFDTVAELIEIEDTLGGYDDSDLINYINKANTKLYTEYRLDNKFPLLVEDCVGDDYVCLASLEILFTDVNGKQFKYVCND